MRSILCHEGSSHLSPVPTYDFKKKNLNRNSGCRNKSSQCSHIGSTIVKRKIRPHLDLLSIPQSGGKHVKTFRLVLLLKNQNAPTVVVAGVVSHIQRIGQTRYLVNSIFDSDANSVLLRALYAQNHVFEIVHQESAKVYLHMYNGNPQQNPLCASHISPVPTYDF